MTAKMTHGAVLLAVVALGCQHASEPDSTTPAPDTTSTSTAKKTQIEADMKTVAFEAQSSRSIVITSGTTMTPIQDGSGTVHGIVLARDNNTGITINCECPAGCSPGDGSDMSPGCAVGVGPNTATCTGNCSASNTSCQSCSFSVPPVAPNSPSAELIKDLRIREQPGRSPSSEPTPDDAPANPTTIDAR